MCPFPICHFVFGVGCGIRLYQFLITAYFQKFGFDIPSSLYTSLSHLPFCIWGSMWNSILSVLYHCLFSEILFWYHKNCLLSEKFGFDITKKKKKKSLGIIIIDMPGSATITPDYIVYGIWGNPTIPHRAQPLLSAAGKMSLNLVFDCSNIHAPVVS